MTACLPSELAEQTWIDFGSFTLACPQGQQRGEGRGEAGHTKKQVM